MITKLRSWSPFRRRGTDDGKFGMFGGVFTPTVLTILGAIMYLRLGQVIGNAGLLGALAIILLAHIITICTGLSVSSIATNTQVGAGGAFAIISRSLGLEVGGAVGVPLYLAQGISVALYVLAFGEGWQRVFPTHSYWLVCLIAFAVVFGAAWRSTGFAFRIQYVILAIVLLSLVSLFLGTIPGPGRPGLVVEPTLWGSFELWDFWTTFAIFFPAVTGIMAGISMSGVLRDVRRSLPLGTMSAIGVAFVAYIALTLWLAAAATPEELLTTETIMVDKALWGGLILAGILGATFSSALGSMVAAPRVMHALALYGLLPWSEQLRRESPTGEPRTALLTTAAIGLVTLLISLLSGGLNAVAGVISMFFIITYGMLNLVVFIELMLNTVSFRPSFRVPRLVPLIGIIGCTLVMFLINPIFSLVAIVLVVALYLFLARVSLDTSAVEDVRSGLFLAVAEWAARQAITLPAAPERTWKPSLLAPVASVGELNGSYRFLRAATHPQGSVTSLGIHPPGETAPLAGLIDFTRAFLADGVNAQTILLEDADFVAGVSAATQVLRHVIFRPNLLFLNLWPDSELQQLQRLVDDTAAYRMGIVLLARHMVNDMGREQIINVWISPPPGWEFSHRAGRNDLAILLALQLQRNWQGTINLCMAIEPDARERAEGLLAELLTLARLPAGSGRVVVAAPFMEALRQAPRADLTVIGLPRNADLARNKEYVDVVDGSCVFVRDSGDESATT